MAINTENRSMTYAEKLRDPRWQKRRAKILERDDYTCLECGDKKTTLNVHHGCYLPGRDPWEYPDQVLHTLCEPCHERTQAYLGVVHAMLGGMRLEELRAAASILAASGLCSLEPPAPPKTDKTMLEHLEIVDRDIVTLERYGSGDPKAASRLKNLRQLAVVLREEMAKEAVSQ